MKAKIKFGGKVIEIIDIERVEGLKKLTGLMFKGKKAKALLFDFKKKARHTIHSFFCPPFLAIWLNEGKVVDFKIIPPNQPLIKSAQNFNKLLEIPLNNKYHSTINFLLDKRNI